MLLFLTLDHKNEIEKTANGRDGKYLQIEQNIIDGVDDCVSKSELTEDEINSASRMPNYFDILQSLGFNRSDYLILQTMTSHGVHGSWTSLIYDYLDEEDGKLVLNFISNKTNDIQYSIVIFKVLNALHSYIKYQTYHSQ